jgi:hypothetical protein
MPFQPLLPKTNATFAGGDAPGQWIEGTTALFNNLSDNLEFDARAHSEVNSIPSPWSRPLQLISAFRNPNYPSRAWLIAQYRGLLTTLALAKNLRLNITATQVRLNDFKNNEFGKCLLNLTPKEDSILRINPPNGPWSEMYLFELDGVVIGMTSPATLVCPTGYFPEALKDRIAWLQWKPFYVNQQNRELGFFADPLNHGLPNKYKQILAPWLSYLRGELLSKPLNAALAGSVGGILNEYITELGVNSSNTYMPDNDQLPYGLPLGYQPLEALYPAAKMTEKSHVQVIPAEGKHPQKPLYVIDQLQLPGILGITLPEINVIDSVTLRDFPTLTPNVLEEYRRKANFASPADFFMSEVYFSRTSNLLPGSWLNQKTSNLNDLTILLPLQSFVQDYFSSEYLEKNLAVESTIIDQTPGVKISLTLYLSGVDRRATYIVSQSFPLKKENELPDDYPTVALWPNLPAAAQINWREFFLMESVLDEEGERYAFQIQRPTREAQQTIRNFGREKYHYWQCDQRPDILEAMSDEAKYLGMIPLKASQLQQGEADSWTVGVDFGTSFTNISLRKGARAPERFKFNPSLLKVTLGSEVKFPEFHDYIYRNFFIPDTLVPEGNLPPMSTALITRGWQEQKNAIAKIITEARIYNPRSDGEFSGYAKTNIKWENIQYQEPFLSQLVRMISVQAASENVHNIEWSISYPSAFSTMDFNDYQDTWERVLADISRVSGQHHALSPRGLQTESVAFAQYFADVLGQNIVHTTCVDIGGGTSDLSIWKDNQLIHQASVPYAGRDLFHNLLRHNLDYFDEIFGLSQDDLKRLRTSLAEDPINFNSILDLRLRMEEEGKNEGESGKPSLASGYRMNKKKERNRQFRTLLAFAYCGLFHYIGLVQKWLQQEEKMTEDYFTSLLLGGNGSRFIHWLSPAGRLQQSSEINELIEGVMLAATGLKANPDLLTLSNAPKQEACGGLVVPPGGEKLRGVDRKQTDNPFFGEVCVINGKEFAPHDRLTLDDEWNEIKEFSLTSTAELEKYLQNFNQVIKERNIEEIEQLRDFKSGELLQLNDDFRKLLAANLRKQCLRKQGPKNQFEPDPPFLMVLKSFLEVLSKQWSRARAD